MFSTTCSLVGPSITSLAGNCGLLLLQIKPEARQSEHEEESVHSAVCMWQQRVQQSQMEQLSSVTLRCSTALTFPGGSTTLCLII